MTTGEIMRERISRGLPAVSGGESDDALPQKPGTMRILNSTQVGRFSKEDIAQARISRRRTIRSIRKHMMPGVSDKEILARFNGYVDPDPTWGVRFQNGQIVREK